jgi:2-C-methyl-D-erythritol 4-phosphate cytidylyltransferase
LLQAHKKAIQDNKEYTDDTEIWGKYCGNVKVVSGDINNIKITYNKDLDKLK